MDQAWAALGLVVLVDTRSRDMIKIMDMELVAAQEVLLEVTEIKAGLGAMVNGLEPQHL
jgi:hypothetical protein